MRLLRPSKKLVEARDGDAFCGGRNSPAHAGEIYRRDRGRTRGRASLPLIDCEREILRRGSAGELCGNRRGISVISVCGVDGFFRVQFCVFNVGE